MIESARIDASRSMVVPEHGFVLWFHPRSMSTSLKAWVLELLGYEVVATGGTPAWTVEGRSIHAARDLAPSYDPQLHEDFFHFTVVKHPLARLASHFRQQAHVVKAHRLHLDTRYEPLNEWPEGTFRKYVEKLVNVPQEYVDPHVQQQSWPIPANHVFVVQSEHLNRDWPNAVTALAAAGRPPRHNVSRQTPPDTYLGGYCADWPIRWFAERDCWPRWEVFYDDTLLGLAAEHYRPDFERFGYGVAGP